MQCYNVTSALRELSVVTVKDSLIEKHFIGKSNIC